MGDLRLFEDASELILGTIMWKVTWNDNLVRRRTRLLKSELDILVFNTSNLRIM